MLVCHLFDNCGEMPGKIFVSDYESDYYEGSGTAILLTEDNRVEIYNLGHCSCYGPLDYGPCETFDSVNKFKESVSCCGDILESKFWELYAQL
jgi:hypothetical protein